MNAHKRYLIKQALRKAKYVKSQEKKKRSNLTNEEMKVIRQGFIDLVKLVPGKENFKPLTKEPTKIGDILRKNG